MSDQAATIKDTKELYTPLQLWETRILRLHPASDPEAPLKADLLRASLADGPNKTLRMDEDLITFEAISYTWGSPGCEGITVSSNGLAVRVMSSLGAALRRFRLPDHHRYLWADFLCINQLDAAEKSLQVANMFNIYREAQRVLAWLGDAGPHTPGAIKYLAQRPRQSRRDTGERGEPKSRIWTSDTTLNLGLADVYRRPWLRRVWVRREVFAPRQISVFFGDCELPFDVYREHGIALQDDLIDAAGGNIGTTFYPEMLDSLRSLRGLTQADDVSIVELQSERQEYLDSTLPEHDDQPPIRERCSAMIDDRSHKFEAVMEESRWLAVSDSRDMVYALLSLTYCPVLPTEPKFGLNPLGMRLDYTKSYSQILQDTTKFVMNRDQSLSILKHINRAPAPLGVERNSNTLPSWAIDWTISSLSDDNDHHVHRPGPRLRWQDPSKCGTISLWGIILSTIHSFVVLWDSGLDLHRLTVNAHSHLRVTVVRNRESALPHLYAREWRPAKVQWFHEPKAVSYKRFLTEANDLDHFKGVPDRSLVAVLVEGTAADEVVYLQPEHDGRFSYVRIGSRSEHLSLFLSDLPQDVGAWDGDDLFAANENQHQEYIVV
ncbi:hypothetical protein LTR27_003382 [Elasticomyces elasticus]|nr:hypothetical protein LTR27_003382 [Elasticomyces elasticus]